MCPFGVGVCVEFPDIQVRQPMSLGPFSYGVISKFWRAASVASAPHLPETLRTPPIPPGPQAPASRRRNNTTTPTKARIPPPYRSRTHHYTARHCTPLHQPPLVSLRIASPAAPPQTCAHVPPALQSSPTLNPDAGTLNRSLRRPAARALS